LSVFDEAMEDLHGDADLSIAAEFRRPPFAWVAVRAILSQSTDAIGGLGGLGARAGQVQADILAAAITDTPTKGDQLRIGATAYTVEAAERDALALSWRLTLSDATQP